MFRPLACHKCRLDNRRGAPSRLFLLSFIILASFFEILTASAQTTPASDAKAEQAFNSILDGHGDGWMCEWRLVMPDRLPAESSKKQVTSFRGFSTLSVDNVYLPSAELPTPRIIIDDFYKGYRLPIYVDDVSRIVSNLDLGLFLGTDPLQDQTGLIVKLSKGDRVDDKYEARLQTSKLQSYLNLENSTFFMDCPEATDDAVELSYRTSDGILLVTDWDGKDITRPLPTGSSGLNAIYIEGFSLRFFKSDPENVVIATMEYTAPESPQEISTRTYPVFLSCHNGTFEVSNLYGEGAEFCGDPLGYGFSNYSEPSAFNFTLQDKAPLLRSTNGSITIEPLLTRISGMNTQSGAITFTDYEDYTFFGFHDRAILSEDAYAGLDLKGMNSNGAALSAFHTALQNSTLGTPYVTITGGNNSHWDRLQNTRSSGKTVEIAPHYLVGINYHYEPYLNLNDSYMSFHFSLDETAVKVQKISFPLPEDDGDSNTSSSSSNIDFVINAYGNGIIGDDTVNEFIYLSGTLFSDSPKTELYLVAEAQLDYDSPAMADTDIGHVDGICIEPFRTAAPLSDSQPSHTYLIPKTALIKKSIAYDRIPTRAPLNDNEVYTLYAKYTPDIEGADPRFRVLETLASDRVTTRVDNLTAKPVEHILEGNRLTAELSDLAVHTIEGRLIATVAKHKTIVLPSGIYLISTTRADNGRSRTTTKITVL